MYPDLLHDLALAGAAAIESLRMSPETGSHKPKLDDTTSANNLNILDNCVPIRARVEPSSQTQTLAKEIVISDARSASCGPSEGGCDGGGRKGWELRVPCHTFVNFSADVSMASMAEAGAEAAGEGGGWVDPEDSVSLNIEETMAVLTRCSFDESHRQPIFMLGGVPAIAELIKVRSTEVFFSFLGA